MHARTTRLQRKREQLSLGAESLPRPFVGFISVAGTMELLRFCSPPANEDADGPETPGDGMLTGAQHLLAHEQQLYGVADSLASRGRGRHAAGYVVHSSPEMWRDPRKTRSNTREPRPVKLPASDSQKVDALTLSSISTRSTSRYNSPQAVSYTHLTLPTKA